MTAVDVATAAVSLLVALVLPAAFALQVRAAQGRERRVAELEAENADLRERLLGGGW